ncbi:hypothetical protein Clacol_000384 [Clathrus columnatus]|uniref:Cerato-platanin n=1 Tax=Clathrus columnatus TaxID=1419009 RepID=A0AAV4ZX25_9AGAM|nr:hypothetical protein Clacol_000384 [Clathrus columnatus]
MKFSAFYLLCLLGIVSPLIAAQGSESASVSYDQTYDVGSTQLTQVACSDGRNGLITKGFSTFNSLPGFPLIGGVPAISGWNSSSCGSCWQLQYQGNTINVLGIDVGRGGFNIALEAMNQLTNNQATFLGRITATATQVSPAACGIRV